MSNTRTMQNHDLGALFTGRRQSHGGKPRPSHQRRKSATGQSMPVPESSGGASQAGGMADDEGEEGDNSANAEKADYTGEAATPTPSSQNTKSVARLTGNHPGGDQKMEIDQPAASAPNSETGDEDAALEAKMAELEARGWRPEEEQAVSVTDEDDYAGVDCISDSDDDDIRVRREEEDAMLGSQGFNAEEEDALVRRLSLSSTGSDLAPVLGIDDLLFTETPFFQAQFMADQLDATDLFGTATPRARNYDEDDHTTQRRVRFEDEVDHSDSESVDSEQAEDFFPDLFIQQDQLDPGFMQLIENDGDLYLEDDASDAGSVWDFEADEMRMMMDEDSDSHSSAGSSGYESDDGDTTDEEPMPPPPRVFKSATSTSPESASEKSTVPRSKIQPQKRTIISKRNFQPRMPKMGTFIIDPNKPVLTIDGTGKRARHILWPARNQTPEQRERWRRMCSLNNSRNNSRTNSPRTSVQLTPADESDGSNPFAQTSFFDLIGQEDAIVPQDAFMVAMEPNFSFSADENDDNAEEDDILGFLNFDENDDDDDDMPDESDCITSPSQNTPFPAVKSKNGGMDDLLAHFDRRRGIVGSFRRNQQFAKHVGSLPSHPELRASTSESNAIQTGRRAAGNTPITPLRRKKIGKDVGARNSPMSPVSKNSSAQRRKLPARGGFSGRR